MNNKSRIYSWGTIWFLGVVLFFTGCSKENPGMDNETNGNPIAFDCSTSNLRATETTADNMRYFRVSAVWNKGAGSYEPFMDNQLVEKQDGIWVYSPIKHWPNDGTVSFFAYSPATSSGVESFQINDAENKVTIGYKITDNYQEQEDFMVATALTKKESPVRLDFSHVLSRVQFRARSEEAGIAFRIKEIKLTNLYNKGTLTGTATGTTTTWTWSESLPRTNYTVYQKYPFETQDDTYREVGDQMILPQTPGSTSKISVTYDIVDTSEEKTKEYPFEDNFIFEPGKRYTFFLELTRE